MWKQVFAVLLIAALAVAQPSEKGALPRHQLQVIRLSQPPDRPIEVQPASGKRLRGWLQEATESGFVMKAALKSGDETRTYRFEDVKSVRSVDSVKLPMSKKKWVLLGVAVFFGLVIGFGLRTYES
jgi:hypothetical protein